MYVVSLSFPFCHRKRKNNDRSFCLFAFRWLWAGLSHQELADSSRSMASIASYFQPRSAFPPALLGSTFRLSTTEAPLAFVLRINIFHFFVLPVFLLFSKTFEQGLKRLVFNTVDLFQTVVPAEKMKTLKRPLE